MGYRLRPETISSLSVILATSLWLPLAADANSQSSAALAEGVAVGPQYDSTRVYVAPANLEAFVSSFVAVFGGQASKRSVPNVLPVPSSAEFQYVWTPVGTLSVFAFHTPVPFPFGQERTGYLVTGMDQAIQGRSFGRGRGYR